MKKVLLVTASLIALGAAAPAVAADLAARPYTKAPPMIAAVYDWSGFYIGANGGWGSSRNCWDFLPGWRLRRRFATMRPAARSVARSAIAGRPAPGCSALKLRATGPTSRATMSSLFDPGSATSSQDRCVRPVHRSGRLRRQQRPVLRQGRCGCDLERVPFVCVATGTLAGVTGDDTRWGGTVGVGLEYGFAPNWSVGVEYNHLFLQDRTSPSPRRAGVFFGNDRIGQDVDLVTARLNYKFGGPVVARY